MRKRIFSVWMMVSLLAFVFQAECSFGEEREPDVDVLSRQEAAEFAEDFMTESEGDLQENLNKEITPMYDEEDDVSAYMVTFEKGDKQRGYAVIDAKENQGQVIEYSYGESNFIEEAKDQVCEDKKEEKSAKVYYLGGLSYVLKTKKEKRQPIQISPHRIQNEYPALARSREIRTMEMAQERKALLPIQRLVYQEPSYLPRYMMCLSQ